MRREQIAIQLYTLRDHLTTVEDVQRTLERCRALGFQAVQLSGITAEISAGELAQRCADCGLTICSSHEPARKIIEQPQAVCDRLQELGCTHSSYPFPHLELTTEQAFIDFAGQLNAAGQVFSDNGLTLAYHHHAIEFRRFGSRTGLDIILSETAPEHLEAELDMYWVQRGGGNPPDWIRKVAGRMTVVHMKDYGVLLDDKQGTFCEVGSGNLNWAEIIPALDAAGVQWFAIEQDRCPGDPFESIAHSFAYLAAQAD